jgi:hypothetical protein
MIGTLLKVEASQESDDDRGGGAVRFRPTEAAVSRAHRKSRYSSTTQLQNTWISRNVMEFLKESRVSEYLGRFVERALTNSKTLW